MAGEEEEEEAARGWCFSSLTGLNPWGWSTGASFLSAGGPCWRAVALGTVPNSYSSVSLKRVLFETDCDAAPFCCPSPRNRDMKFVLQGKWFVPPLLPPWIFTGRQQREGSITLPCPANSAGRCPLGFQLTWVCAPCICPSSVHVDRCPWANV